MAEVEEFELTHPNFDIPPGEPRDGPYFGNGTIWTALWPDGVVRVRKNGPGDVRPDGMLEMKRPWWRDVEGPLQISGTLLDGPQGRMATYTPAGYGATGFQPVVLVFSAPGTWSISARVGEYQLSLVTRVVQVP